MTDPIADMLTRIRNAHMARKTAVAMPYSKIKHAIADILVAEGYLAEVHGEGVQGQQIDHKAVLHLALKYKQGVPAIKSLKRISTPGCRMYIKSTEIPRVHNGHGIAILSTPRGVLSDKQARELKVGGEFLCEIF